MGSVSGLTWKFQKLKSKKRALAKALPSTMPTANGYSFSRTILAPPILRTAKRMRKAARILPKLNYIIWDGPKMNPMGWNQKPAKNCRRTVVATVPPAAKAIAPPMGLIKSTEETSGFPLSKRSVAVACHESNWPQSLRGSHDPRLRKLSTPRPWRVVRWMTPPIVIPPARSIP